MTPTLSLLLALAAAPAADRSYPLAEAPPALRPALERGEAAAGALQKRLQGRLGEALKQGGLPAAVDACSADAARLAAETARETGVGVGRTSLRLRSGANAAPAWAVPFLQAASGKRAAEVAALAVELPGGKVGLLKPIAVGTACLRCHGGAEQVPAEVRQKIAARYPEDRAVGFAEGDLRGFFWAEVAR